VRPNLWALGCCSISPSDGLDASVGLSDGQL